MSDLDSLSALPRWHPSSDVLELAELVLSGALGGGFARFAVPAETIGAGRRVVLEDAEGTPVALLELPGPNDAGPNDADPNDADPNDAGPTDRQRLTAVRPFAAGPLRSVRRSPAAIAARLGDGASAPLAVPVTGPLTTEQVGGVLARATGSGRPLLWLAVFGTHRHAALPPAGLWRAVRALAEQAVVAGLDSLAVPVAVPLAPGVTAGSDSDVTVLAAVAHGYGAADVVRLDAAPTQPIDQHPAFAAELDRAMPPPRARGVTLFFTGLSGSGKSTVAKALAERLEQDGERTVSLLDGDEVRRLLSAGLTFSRADRDLNIRRIGFVATEVTRHGGLAICAPIAPFDQARQQVRASVRAVGDFVLIHVSTSLAECERRDRKGLYAQARKGLIADFTGISSPYEVPADADLSLDTERLEVAEAVEAVCRLLVDRGYLAKS